MPDEARFDYSSAVAAPTWSELRRDADAEAMMPVNAIVADILKHRNAMVALSKKHGTDPLDVLCMVENLTEWAHAIEREIRR